MKISTEVTPGIAAALISVCVAVLTFAVVVAVDHFGNRCMYDVYQAGKKIESTIGYCWSSHSVGGTYYKNVGRVLK